MSDHDYYQELAALSAAGLLSEREAVELRQHTDACAACLKTEEEFKELIRSGLPVTTSPLREFVQRTASKPDDGVRARFLARARREGIVFSPGVAEPIGQPARRLWSLPVAAGVAAAILLMAFYGPRPYRIAAREGSVQSADQVERLQKQNASLNATLSQLNQSLAAEQREIQNLRVQLGTAERTADSLRRDGEQARSEAQQASGQIVQLPAELANRDKQLAEARNEIERINELRSFDEASLVAQQVKIAELSDQLRTASATLELERQLAAAGKDIRELLVARQLHVIDVRDTNVNGKPSKAFGRIFVSEGKSLTFYAFDLSQERSVDVKHRFEVWGSQQAKGSPARSLGFFYVDDKTQSRWALRVTDPQLVKEVDSVFVTVEPAGGAPTPSGQRMLYAYLGQPNHP